MARNGSGGPGGGAMRLAAALTSVAIAACLASVPRLAQALGGHDSLEAAATLEILDDRGSSALEVVEDGIPGVAAEDPVVATAQAEKVASGSVGTAKYEYFKDGNQYTLTVKDGTFTKNQWNNAIKKTKRFICTVSK